LGKTKWIIEVECVHEPETYSRYWTFTLRRLIKESVNTLVCEAVKSYSKSKTREDAIRLAELERDRHLKRGGLWKEWNEREQG